LACFIAFLIFIIIILLLNKLKFITFKKKSFGYAVRFQFIESQDESEIEAQDKTPKMSVNLADRKARIGDPVVFEVRIEKFYEIDDVKWTFRPMLGNVASGIHSEDQILESRQEDIQLQKSESNDFTILTCVMGSFQPKYIGTISVTISNKYGEATSKCICSLDLANDQFRSTRLDDENYKDSSNSNNFPARKFNKISSNNASPNISLYNISEPDPTQNEQNEICIYPKLPDNKKIRTRRFDQRKWYKNSNNARLYNLSEEGDSIEIKKEQVKCQGYTSDVSVKVKGEHTFKKSGDASWNRSTEDGFEEKDMEQVLSRWDFLSES